MTAAYSGTGSSRGWFFDLLDSLSRVGLQIGGLIFGGTCAYLLWGVFSGSWVQTGAFSQQDQGRVWGDIGIFCKAFVISGFALLISAAYRFYAEEVTGYLFLIGGAALYWGIPILVGSTVQSVLPFNTSASPTLHVVNQFRLVGIVALVLAAPLVLIDFYFKLRRAQSSTQKSAVSASQKLEVPRARLYLFCWQTPYCRDFVRKYCKAYEQRKSCWRIKSGCYCDEGLILLAMRREGAKAAGFDQQFSATATPQKSKRLTEAEKRQRCRECFLYIEHQKQKYRLLSPLVFPAVIGLLWAYFKPIKAWLEASLVWIDKRVTAISVLPSSEYSPANQWVNGQAMSDVVVWLFIICVGVILITYLLRALEYAIFELQI